MQILKCHSIDSWVLSFIYFDVSIQVPERWTSSLLSVTEISVSLCTDANQKYGDRDFGGRERWVYFSARQKGRHSKLVPQELCPSPSGIGEDFICGARSPRVYDKDQSSEGLAFFFLNYFKTVILACDLFSEMQMLQRVICYEGGQDVIHRVLKSNQLALCSTNLVTDTTD